MRMILNGCAGTSRLRGGLATVLLGGVRRAGRQRDSDAGGHDTAARWSCSTTLFSPRNTEPPAMTVSRMSWYNPTRSV